MAAAKYLVTDSAVYVPPLGYLPQGRIFDAPADFIPSTSFRCLNEEASTALASSFDATEARLLERLDESVGAADKTKVQNELDALRAKRSESLRVLSASEASELSSKFAATAVPSRVTGS